MYDFRLRLNNVEFQDLYLLSRYSGESPRQLLKRLIKNEILSFFDSYEKFQCYKDSFNKDFK